MRLSLLIASASALCLTACATIDFADMAPQQEVAVIAPVQDNVVIRSANALYTQFTEKGWAAAPDPNRMQKAANVLLRGIGQSERVFDASYAGRAKDIKTVRRDIMLASDSVAKAYKAADVFLAMAPADESLQLELQALERALAACHKAEMMFARALEKVGAADVEADLSALNASAFSLKAIANSYGEHVRAKASIGGAAS